MEFFTKVWKRLCLFTQPIHFLCRKPCNEMGCFPLPLRYGYFMQIRHNKPSLETAKKQTNIKANNSWVRNAISYLKCLQKHILLSYFCNIRESFRTSHHAGLVWDPGANGQWVVFIQSGAASEWLHGCWREMPGMVKCCIPSRLLLEIICLR